MMYWYFSKTHNIWSPTKPSSKIQTGENTSKLCSDVGGQLKPISYYRHKRGLVIPTHGEDEGRSMAYISACIL